MLATAVLGAVASAAALPAAAAGGLTLTVDSKSGAYTVRCFRYELRGVVRLGAAQVSPTPLPHYTHRANMHAPGP
eukprot:SAG22_NODE_5819_length_947_cov_1.515330_3_plen_75_part_00